MEKPGVHDDVGSKNYYLSIIFFYDNCSNVF